MLACNAKLFVVFGRMGGLSQDLCCTARLSPILVRRASNLLSRAYDITIAGPSKVFTRQVNHWQWSQCLRMQAWWMSLKAIGVVDDLTLRQRCQGVAAGLRSCSLSGFGCSGSLLSSSIFFGKPLLAGFRLPVVIPYATTIFDQSRAKLSKHGSCCDNSNLARPVRVWQDFLLDEVVSRGKYLGKVITLYRPG